MPSHCHKFLKYLLQFQLEIKKNFFCKFTHHFIFILAMIFDLCELWLMTIVLSKQFSSVKIFRKKILSGIDLPRNMVLKIIEFTVLINNKNSSCNQKLETQISNSVRNQKNSVGIDLYCKFKFRNL